jgi:hypothetical protein
LHLSESHPFPYIPASNLDKSHVAAWFTQSQHRPLQYKAHWLSQKLSWHTYCCSSRDFCSAKLRGWAKVLIYSINHASNQREKLREILRECGTSGWYVFTASRLDPTASKFILFNVSERKKAETVIPDEWFDDHRYGAIKELISSVISESTPIKKGNGDDATKPSSDELSRGSELASRLAMDRRTET